MVELTSVQAQSLLQIVNFANHHGGRVPTGPEFAKILGIGTRGALARINRILNKGDFSKKEQNSRFIDYDKLITEKESAQFCLNLFAISQKSNHGRMTIADISKELGLPGQECENFATKCCKAGYLIPIASNIEAYRAGPKIFSQIIYLELVSSG